MSSQFLIGFGLVPERKSRNPRPPESPENPPRPSNASGRKRPVGGIVDADGLGSVGLGPPQDSYPRQYKNQIENGTKIKLQIQMNDDNER